MPNAQRLLICLAFAAASFFISQPVYAQSNANGSNVTQPKKQQGKVAPKPKNPAFETVVDDPALPRVLLIGDSISIGYTLPVRKRLKGVANLHRIPVNGGPTTRGVTSIDSWLGDQKWDVIHFNFGLHDLKYVDDKLKNTTVDAGHQQVPPEDYRKNLTAIVERLESTSASLIWRPTTIVPEDSVSRIAGAEAEYNKVAAEVIAGRNIAVNDLNGLIASRPELQRAANVHFTPEGSDELGASVAKSIVKALRQRKKSAN